jgi:hypothetical protein
MFVPSDVAVIGQTVLEKIDLVFDRTDQRLLPNSAHPDQRGSQVQWRVMLYGPDGGSLAVGRKGKQLCQYTNIIVWYAIGTLKSWS